MRTIRRAALVGITAASLALGSTLTAVADDDMAPAPVASDAPAADSTPADGTTPAGDENKEPEKTSSLKSLSSKKEDKKDDEGNAAQDKGLSASFKGLSSKKEGENAEGEPGGNLSSKLGAKLDADQPANGQRLWGSTNEAQNEPKWAQLMRAVTIVSVLGSVLGLVVFPAYNFLLANGLIHR